MKKLLFVLLSILFFSSNPIMGEEEKEVIDLNLEIIDDTPTGPGRGKLPIRKPIIYQDGQKITFSSSHPEYIINIVQDDEVMFSSVIPSGVPEFEIPPYVDGECILQLIIGRFIFWGIISF